MKIVFILSCLFASPQTYAQVIAKVGNKDITTKEFEDRYAVLKEQMVDVPDKKTLLEDMINFEVGVQEAQKRNLDQDPIIRDRMLQELYKGFVERELAPKTAKIAVDDSEMKSYYSRYPEIRLSHIMIEVRSDATPEQKKEARKRAQEIYETVKKSNRKFEDLAKIYSDDLLTNKAGGDIGWQTKVTVHPSIYKAATNLSVNGISNLVDTPYGFFIIKLTGKKSFNEADRSMLRLAVQEEKKKKLYDQFISGVRSKYKVQINKSAL